MAHPGEATLIYNWNLKGRRGSLAPGVEFYDETLRDGIQGPSISDPSIEDKMRILELQEAVGIDCTLFPGAGALTLKIPKGLKSP